MTFIQAEYIFIANIFSAEVLSCHLCFVLSHSDAYLTVFYCGKKPCEPAPSCLVCRTIRCRYVRIIMGTARQNKLVGMALWQTSELEHEATHFYTKASLATP